jgi:mRNA interferase MazF
VAKRGDVVLARFPFTDQTGAKLRPVLILARLAGPHPDYLVMFVSSQRGHATGDDFVLDPSHAAFGRSGLKVASLFRIGKVATISEVLIVGTLGELDGDLTDLLVERLVKLVRGA